MNLTANMFGLSNATTPLGIKAMSELNKINKEKDGRASNDMALFLVINANLYSINSIYSYIN